DLHASVAVGHMPVDLDRVAVAALDLAADDGLLATRPGSGNVEWGAPIFAEPRAIGLREVFLEQRHEFLVLLRRQAARVGAENKAGRTGQIEIALEQATKLSGPLGCWNRRAKHLDRLTAEMLDKRCGVLRRSA